MEIDKEKWIDQLFRQTQKRVQKTGLEMNITKNYLRYLWQKNGGSCALTGIVFHETVEAKNMRRPFVPSIDRVDRTKGYLKNNIRLVCVAVNMALFTWGSKIFDIVVEQRAKFLQKDAHRQNGHDEHKTPIRIVPKPEPKPELPQWLEQYSRCVVQKPLSQKEILGRGETETLFNLRSGWFAARIKKGLPVPNYCEIQRPNTKNPWYKYDRVYLEHWLNVTPGALYHPAYDEKMYL